MDKKKVLFVINPLAGGNDKTSFTEALDRFCEENSMRHTVFYTSGENDLQRLKNEINHVVPEIIVAVGGDGTCNLVGTAIVNTGKIMAIIPFGSANGMARELNIPANPTLALEILLKGNVKVIDTITINKKVCMHLSDIGLNAKVIKRFEEEKVRGIYGYARQFFKELIYYKASRYSFFSEQGHFTKKAHVVAIANATRYGTGAVINPNGKNNDGKFEICIVKPYPVFAFFSIMAAIFFGYLDKIKYADIQSVTHIKIINTKNQPLHIDGEIIEDAKTVEAEINPLSLKIIAP